jgi:hypothetical protein
MKTEVVIAPDVPTNRPVTRVICDALALMPAGGTSADLLVPYLRYRGITEAPEKLGFALLHQCKRALKANLRAVVQEGFACAAGMRDRKTVYVLLDTPKPKPAAPAQPAKIKGTPKAKAEVVPSSEPEQCLYPRYCPPVAPPRQYNIFAATYTPEKWANPRA